MKLKILTLFLCCLSLVSAWSQKTVTGTVTDEASIPLMGVNIMVNGTSTGANTDFDGNYTIKLKEGQVLNFSYVGYETQEITLTTQESINVILKESSSELEEVVIVGYGRQKKESVLGAISQIKGTELLESGTTNIINAMSSIAAGVSIIQTSGQPGDEAGEIYIRGNADPLILVDGVEVVGGFDNIDTNNVENISVLKDGSATAVYGVRGANGVIIITTKRGRTGKPVVSFNTQVTAKTLNITPDILDAYSAQKALNTGVLNDQNYGGGYSYASALDHYKSGDLPYIYPNTDWQELLFKDYATSMNSTLSVRGGNDFVKYFASAGYVHEGDLINTVQYNEYDPKYKFDKFTFRSNLDFTITKSTQLKTSISSRLESKSKPASSFSSTPSFTGLYTNAPGYTVPVYPAEVMEQYPDPLYPGVEEIRFGLGPNVWRSINDTGINESNKTVFSVDLELVQDLDVVTKGLTFTAKYNFNSSYTTAKSTYYDNAVSRIQQRDQYQLLRDGTWDSNTSPDNEITQYYIEGSEGINAYSTIEYGRAQINYVRSFGKHNVTAMGLFSRSKRVINKNFPYYQEDWVARATYNYDSRYFVEFAGSYNGDESFAEGYRFKFFPSVSLGYNLAKEDFIADNIPQINNFKLRYSYGETGNKAGLKIANTNPTQYERWLYDSYFGSDSNRDNSRFSFGEDYLLLLPVIKETQIGNPVLTWATVTKRNIGLDFGLFDNKISGAIDFFSDNRTGLIGNAVVPIYYGNNADLPKANVNETKSHGVDIEVMYKNVTSGGFSYSIRGIYGFYENRVVSNTADGAGTPEYTRLAGKAIGTTSLLADDGYFQNIDELLNYPTYAGNPGLGDYRFIDFNANGTVLGGDTEDYVRYSYPKTPQHTYSFNFNFGYKRWSLNALINGVEGHKGLVSNALTYALYKGVASGRVEQLDTWSPTNTSAAYPSLHSGQTNTNLVDPNTANLVSLDYIKLRSVNLAYKFDMSESKHISNLRLYISGNNLITISELSYGDPEGNSPGSYPVATKYNLGLSMDF